MKTGILFAGQGSQKPGMGKDLYEKSELFKETFNMLPDEMKEYAFEGPAEKLQETVNTQPVIVAFAVGVMKELEKAGIKPDMAAGLSLGEYSALYAAGVFDDETVLDVIKLRASEMSKASDGIDCAMQAVLGLEREKLEKCCEDASGEGVVSMVNFNCPGQIVISGERKAVEKCGELAIEAGAKRVMNLPVSGPFHTEFMKPAGEALKEKFKTIKFNNMKFPVIFNATGRPLAEGETVADLLVKQVSGSVYFEDTVRYMEEKGIDTVIEVGPGKTLSSFVRKTAKNIRCFNIENADDLEKVISQLKGEQR